MEVITLEGDAAQRFSDAARDATWARMSRQMERHPMGLEHNDTLIEKFNDL
ncbi:MAG TPA: hypothetical protein VLO13_08560 [Halomonas sp.]|nr:hypothetical protein [Halomonas sp.]